MTNAKGLSRIPSRILFPFLLGLVFTVLPSVPASAQPVLHEAGFTVTPLGSGLGPKGVACSPGGVWGDYIYFSDSVGNLIERVDFFDVGTSFASGLPDIDFPVGLAFGPGPANTFGTFLYVGSYGSNQITRVDPSGTTSLFAPFALVSDLAFDPSGSYGSDLFATEFQGSIFTVDPTGVVSPFSTVSALYLKFGPGGAWGTGLYASTTTPGPGISQVSPAGVATVFSGGFSQPEQFDWATGGSFGGDMFVADVITHQVWRVHSDGTRTLFLDGPHDFAGIAFCNGCLYVSAFHGGCWRICNDQPIPTEEATWGVIKQRYASQD